MIRTRTGQVFLHEEKIIVVRIAQKVQQTIDDAKENLAASIELAHPTRKPLLVDIRNCEPLEAEVRHYYSGKQLVQSFTALALLVDASPLGIMMANVYFRVAKPGVPTHLFTNEAEALAWLNGYLNE